jgi:hypothetical protein
LLVWGALAFFAGLFLYFSDYQSPFSSTQTVGSIDFLEERVRIKAQNSLSWTSATEGLPLHDFDQVYTHRGSRAILNLTNQGQIEIFENTLIRLQQHHGATTLQLGQGVINARLENQESLFLYANGKMFELKSSGAELQIIQGSEDLNIQVVSGEATLQSESIVVNLDSSAEMTIQGEEIREQTLFLLEDITPPTNSIFYTQAERAIHFQWTSSVPVRFTLSRNPQLNTPLVQRENINTGELMTSLQPGTYYWRLDSASTLERGVVQRLTIRPEVPPRWRTPRSSQSVYRLPHHDLRQIIPLAWIGDSGQYLVQVNDKEIEVSTNSTELELDQIGSYLIQVKAMGLGREEALWSTPISVQLTTGALPRPYGVYPRDRSRYVSFDSNALQTLRWRPEAGITQYRLEVTTPLQEVYEIEVDDHTFAIQTPVSGRYQWRVQSLNEHGQSEYSPHYVFEMQLEHFQPTAPEDGLKVVLDRPEQHVRFEWARARGVREYVFELAQDKDFKTIIHSDTGRRARADIQIQELGDYYWRTKVITRDGEEYYSTPFRVIIEPSAPPERPNIRGKLKIERLQSQLAPPRRTWWQLLGELILSSAHAEESVSPGHALRISWPAVEQNVKAYRIRVSDSEGTLVFERDQERAEFIWHDPIPGQYSWEIAYIDYWNQVGPYSYPETIFIKDLTQPAQVELVAPAHASQVQSQTELLFRWLVVDPDKTVIAQRLLIAQDLEFEQLIEDIELSIESRTHQWPAPSVDKETTLYWRVKLLASHDTFLSLRRRLELTPESLTEAKEQDLEKLSPVKHLPSTRIGVYYQAGSYQHKQSASPGFQVKGESLLGIRADIFARQFYLQLQNNGGKAFDDYDFRRTSALASFQFNMGDSPWSLGLASALISSSLYFTLDNTTVQEKQLTDFAVGLSLLAHQPRFDFHLKALYGSALWLSADGIFHTPWWLSIGGGVEQIKLSKNRNITGAKFLIGKRFSFN